MKWVLLATWLTVIGILAMLGLWGAGIVSEQVLAATLFSIGAVMAIILVVGGGWAIVRMFREDR